MGEMAVNWFSFMFIPPLPSPPNRIVNCSFLTESKEPRHPPRGLSRSTRWTWKEDIFPQLKRGWLLLLPRGPHPSLPLPTPSEAPALGPDTHRNATDTFLLHFHSSCPRGSHDARRLSQPPAPSAVRPSSQHVTTSDKPP